MFYERLGFPQQIARFRSLIGGFAQVLDAHGLALRPGHGAWAFDINRADDANHRFEVLSDLGCFGRQVGLIRRCVGAELNLDGDSVERPLARQHDLVMRRQTGKADEAGFATERR
jgi:hypothetical protein